MKKLISLILAAAMVVALAACGSTSGQTATTAAAAGEATTAAAAQGETEAATEAGADSSVLKVALTNSFTGCSAINNVNPYRFASLSQVYETLLSCTEDGVYEPGLAKSYEKKSDDTYAVELYEGIVDSEGNPFTADDVAWALKAHKEAGNNLANYYGDDCVKVIDDTHCEITFTNDSVGSFYRVAAEMLMCTQEAYEASSDQMATMAIGTGPYVMESYTEGSSCILVKNENYWQTGEVAASQVANYDRIEISYIKEATQMSGAITNKDVQFAGQVDMSISTEVDGKEGITTDYITNGTYNGVGFNMKGRLVSDNLDLREAIAYAIDPQGLIDAVYKGHGVVMTTYGLPSAVDFNEKWTSKYSYDVEKAKASLEKAGYKDGVTLTLVANNVGEDSQIAELIQGYLSMIGITLELDYVEPATQKARIAEGNWDIALVGGMAVTDMYMFWSNIYAKKSDTGMSTYFHNDEALYKIYDAFEAVGGKTEENLQALYDYEAANCTWFPMFNKQILYCVDSSLTSYEVQPNYMSEPYLGTLK